MAVGTIVRLMQNSRFNVRYGGEFMRELLTTLARRLRGLVDAETLAHCGRVACLGAALGEALGLTREMTRTLYIGGLLHDIGKGAIPAEVLGKPGRLLPEERRLVEAHPAAGESILLQVVPEITPDVVDVVRHHHERLDGSGYPDGLRGPDVSQAARIIAVADVYDALVSDRPYRRALSREEALEVLAEEVRCGRLDADVVAALRQVSAVERLPRAAGARGDRYGRWS